MERLCYFLIFAFLWFSGDAAAAAGCQTCSKTDPPGVAGFNKDRTGNLTSGCLIRKITCNRPNYVIYRSPNGIVSQADPNLVLECNKDSKWVTRDEQSIIDSVDCHNSTQPKKPKTVCVLNKESGMCLAYMPRWYFDNEAKECKEFVYGGCGGNGNRFGTKNECESTCLE